VHRFYREDSSSQLPGDLGCLEEGWEVEGTAVTMEALVGSEAIRKKVGASEGAAQPAREGWGGMLAPPTARACATAAPRPAQRPAPQVEALGLDAVAAAISTVDGEYSAGAVLVLVTGTLAKQSPAGSRARPFAQSFLLCPQDKGFYVKTDILRLGGQAVSPAAHEPGPAEAAGGRTSPATPPQEGEEWRAAAKQPSPAAPSTDGSPPIDAQRQAAPAPFDAVSYAQQQYNAQAAAAAALAAD
jgi:hypothetical protein